MSTMLSNLDLLRRVPLFSLLTVAQAEVISGAVIKRRFKRGEALVEQGQKSNALFILLTGRARVVTSDSRGREVILLQLSIEGVKEKDDKVLDERFENTGGAPGMVRLFLNIGRKQGIRPQDIVRTFASEVDIPGSIIGVINIYDKFTFVEVPKDIAEKVISVMHRNTIKGYKLNIEPAKGK